VRGAADDRGLELRVELPAAGLLVRADRDRLVQALVNLLSNAVKVTQQGVVAVRVTAEGDEAVFTVSDTGPGMSAELAGRMFEPYWRSKSVTYRGTGLGLSIVRGIVEAHDGRIWVETSEGAGATFRFTLPLVRPPAD
jgi:signal transduction histidine kinase